jgi:hypothetical protein
MAVRPVDSLTMLPRLDQTGRIVHQHDQQPYAFQQVLGQQVQEKAERERTQVKQKAQVEQPVIQNNGQRGQGGDQGANGQGQRRRTPEAPQTKPSRVSPNGRLDVKV